MLSAALRGKIPITEDLLTAALFDALEATTDSTVLGRLLGLAETISGGRLELPAWKFYKIKLWSQTPAGEPDVVLDLLQGARPVARVVVEVKFGAGKSGEGELEEEPGRGDQLARYAVAVAKEGAAPVFVIYLTEHACLPNEELEVSLREIARSPQAPKIKGLAWLSWRDVEHVLSAQAPGSPLERVAQVLRRVDMFRFSGEWPQPPVVDGRSSTFYRTQVLYRYPPNPELPESWRYGQTAYAWPAPPDPIRSCIYGGVS